MDDAVTSTYRKLSSERTVETIARLQTRIHERFPASGLSKVCSELHQISIESKTRTETVARPNYILRTVTGIAVIAIVGSLLASIFFTEFSVGPLPLTELVVLTEAALNDVVLVGAAILFLVTVETRVKRSRTLTALHELRTMVHVIDMHQLTKDPSRTRGLVILTPSSPKQTLTEFQLARYLDYCSEMLSLTGKLAALYAQNSKDGVVLSSVNELENLTTSLSQKIWQKITILDEHNHQPSETSQRKLSTTQTIAP